MANLTLRKVKKIGKKIDAAIMDLMGKIKTSRELSVFCSPEAVATLMEQASEEFANHVVNLTALSQVRNDLRIAVATANVGTISEMVTRQANLRILLEQKTKILNDIQVAKPLDILKQVLAVDKARYENPPARSYDTPSDTVMVNFVSEDTKNRLAEAIQQIKREIDEIQEELDRLGFITTIQVSDDTLGFLRSLAVI